jgi:hypothetical protein
MLAREGSKIANSGAISCTNPLAHSSVDEDYGDIEYRLNSERDEYDNLTLKNSFYNLKESIISQQSSNNPLQYDSQSELINGGGTNEKQKKGKKRRSGSRHPAEPIKPSGGGGGPDTPRELTQSKSSRKDW